MGTKLRAFLSALTAAAMLLTCPAGVWAGDDGGEPADPGALLDAVQETEEYWDAVALEAATGQLELSARSAILMEASTGKVLYEYNADESLPPASVTKIMTILLVAEAIDGGKISLDDVVTASAEASGMGGSQIFLKENEEMTVSDLLKATVVASANDAAYALAEYVAGSEPAFVSMMNERAAELGMTGTLFANTTGLPGDEHYSTARDIAVMSRELLKHEFIFEYTTIWMDYLRDGATQLVNTNKLIRHYTGATGLKTGSTDEAGCCISATAERDGLSLIAVVLGSPTGSQRFDDAKMLLDYGFLNFSAVTPQLPSELPCPEVTGGEETSVKLEAGMSPLLILPRGSAESLEITVTAESSVKAPVEKGDELGKITVSLDGEVLAEIPLTAAGSVKKLTWWYVFSKTVANFLTL